MNLTMTARAGVGASAYTARDYYTQRPVPASRHTFTDRVESVSERDWAAVIENLRSLRTLEDDWDGQGAVAPHTAIVDAAIGLAKQFRDDAKPSPDFAVASVNGTVVFEWHLLEGFLEIEVTEPEFAEQRWVRKGSKTAEVSYLGRIV